MGSCPVALDVGQVYAGLKDEPDTSKMSTMYSDIGWLPIKFSVPTNMILNAMFINRPSILNKFYMVVQ